jgi:hypothetical protein
MALSGSKWLKHPLGHSVLRRGEEIALTPQAVELRES